MAPVRYSPVAAVKVVQDDLQEGKCVIIRSWLHAVRKGDDLIRERTGAGWHR